MTEPTVTLVLAAAGLTAIAILATVCLAAWRGWLALRHAEIDRRAAPATGAGPAGTRIEIADLKERIRKLEAIAAGVEL